MKKENVLYGILISGCILEFMFVSVLMSLLPIPIIPAACLTATAAGITTMIIYCLMKKFFIADKKDCVESQSDSSENISYSIGILVKERQELLDKLEAEKKGAELLHQELHNRYEDTEKIKKQNKVLIGWIENFPYKISPNFQLYNLFETEIVTGAYSRWVIPGEENGILFSVELIRPDSQNKIELFQMLQNIHTKEDILKFDMAHEMFNPELQSA